MISISTPTRPIPRLQPRAVAWRRRACASVLMAMLATPAMAQATGKFDLKCTAPGPVGDQTVVYRVDLDNRLWTQTYFDDTGAFRVSPQKGYFATNLRISDRRDHWIDQHQTDSYIQGDWLLFNNSEADDGKSMIKIGANLRTLAYVEKKNAPHSPEIVTAVGHCERLPYTGP